MPFCLRIICKTECVLSTFAILPLPTVPYIFCRNGRRCNIWTRPSIKLCNIWILPAGRISREPLPSFWTPRGSEAESGQSWGVLKINNIVVTKNLKTFLLTIKSYAPSGKLYFYLHNRMISVDQLSRNHVTRRDTN